MCKLLALLGTPVNATRVTGSYNIANILRNTFNKDTLLLWRVRLLNSIGHARLALHSINPLLSLPSDENVVTEYAQALFHKGNYKLSASEFLHASHISSDFRSKLLRKLDASDALRCFGHITQAKILIKQVLSKTNSSSSNYPDIMTRAILKEMLLINNQNKVFQKFFCGIGTRSLEKKIKSLVQKGAPLALRNGLWLEFQQFKLWADRLNMPLGTLSSQGGYEPLPTRDGYQHLGYYIPLLMELYDRANNSTSTITEKEITEGFSSSEKLGCHPPAWKIARTAMRLFPNQHPMWRKRYKEHFSVCQYSLIQKVGYKLKWP